MEIHPYRETGFLWREQYNLNCNPRSDQVCTFKSDGKTIIISYDHTLYEYYATSSSNAKITKSFSEKRVSFAVRVNLDGSLLVTTRESLKSYQTLVINAPLSRIVNSLQSILRRFLRAHGHKTENGSRLGMVLVISFFGKQVFRLASHS